MPDDPYTGRYFQSKHTTWQVGAPRLWADKALEQPINYWLIPVSSPFRDGRITMPNLRHSDTGKSHCGERHLHRIFEERSAVGYTEVFPRPCAECDTPILNGDHYLCVNCSTLRGSSTVERTAVNR